MAVLVKPVCSHKNEWVAKPCAVGNKKALSAGVVICATMFKIVVRLLLFFLNWPPLGGLLLRFRPAAACLDSWPVVVIVEEEEAALVEL